MQVHLQRAEKLLNDPTRKAMGGGGGGGTVDSAQLKAVQVLGRSDLQLMPACRTAGRRSHGIAAACPAAPTRSVGRRMRDYLLGGGVAGRGQVP